MHLQDGPPNSWRDLADTLTTQQIAELEYWDAHPELPPRTDGSSPSAKDHARALLSLARSYLSDNAAGALFADVAPPPDEGVHYSWEHAGDGQWVRFFTGASIAVGKTTVMINGLQHQDGTIARSITIDGETECLDAADARRVAAAINELAGQAER